MKFFVITYLDKAENDLDDVSKNKTVMLGIEHSLKFTKKSGTILPDMKTRECRKCTWTF